MAGQPVPAFWKNLGGGLVAALVLLAIWVPWHPAEPLLPTADLYTHASCARHLVRGEGFQTDIAYPLSFAFPFARQLPQPLIHRGPGFALVMTLPYAAAGGDPTRTILYARFLQILLLGLIVWTGATAFLRRGQLVDLAPWGVLLGTSALLVFAVDWIFDELLASWLLLVLWLRIRTGQHPRLLDGLLAGLLTLLRLELFWVPLLWWLWFGLERQQQDRRHNFPDRHRLKSWLLALGLILLVQVPWAARNLQLTGQLFFSLQGQAELAKDTRAWPGYSVYQQLTPQPVGRVLGDDPIPLLRKVARGVKFHILHLPDLVPWPYLLLMGLLVMMLIRGKITQTPCPFRRDRDTPLGILPDDNPLGPLAAAGFTTLLLIMFYALFDHSLRHLLVIFPILAWECSPLTGHLATDLLARRLPSWPHQAHPVVLLLASAALTGLVVWATGQPLVGWDQARSQARAAAPRLAGQVEAFRQAPPDSLFVPNGAWPWYADRPGVWDPGEEGTRQRIRDYLAGDDSRP